MAHGNNNKKNKKIKSEKSTVDHPTRSLPEGVPYQTQTEDYRRPKVFVATPCYVGQVHVKYMESVMSLQNMLMQNGIGFEFFNIPFDSLIPRARNASVTRFMQSPGATHLLFIDADIQFHPSSVIKMLQENKDVICGCYPKKAVDFEAVKNNYSKTSNQVELIQSSVHYAFNFKPQRTHKIERGVVEILDAPTGFMMVKKKVVRDMIRKYPETEYLNDVKAYQVKEDDRFFDLFQSQVFNRRYLSEDYGFCRLWQMMGGQIFADLTVKLNHIGQFCYFGDPIVYLKFSNSITMSSDTPPGENTSKPNETPTTTTETEADPEADPTTTADPVADPTTTAETEAEAEPDPEADPVADPEADPVADTEADPETEAETEADPEADPTTTADPVVDPETDLVAEAEAEAEADPETETEADPETETEADPETETETEAEVNSNQIQ